MTAREAAAAHYAAHATEVEQDVADAPPITPEQAHLLTALHTAAA